MDYCPGKKEVVAAAIGGLILGIPFLLNAVSDPSTVTAASISISGVLTYALVVLYRQQAKTQEEQTNLQQTQTDIQKTQTDIQQTQTELMEREFQAFLAFGLPVIVEGDEATLKLQNTGRGIIQEVLLRCEIFDEEGVLDFEPGTSWLQSTEGDGAMIQSHSGIEEFRGTVRVTAQNLPFQFVSNNIKSADIEEFTLRLTLEYFDESTRDDEESIREREVAETVIKVGEATDGRKLSDILSEWGHTTEIMPYDSRLLP